GLLKDKNPQVQLMSLLALADMPSSSDAADPVRTALATNKDDRLLTEAGIAAAARHDIHFLKSVVKNSGKSASVPGTALAIVAEHYARGCPGDTAPALVASLGAVSPEISEGILTGMAKGWPRNKTIELSDANDAALVGLFDKLPAAARGSLINLAIRWGSKS